MSHQRPIFTTGLYGKANHVVMNGMVEAVETVGDYRGALEWARQQLAEDPQTMRSFPAVLSSAASMGAGTYRWTYSGSRAVFLSSGSPQVESINDSTDGFSGAYNLRELFNQTNPVDGMNPTVNPEVTVGPVGASYTSTNTWSVTSLKAVVIMYVTLDKQGNVFRFFDRPNPVRCKE